MPPPRFGADAAEIRAALIEASRATTPQQAAMRGCADLEREIRSCLTEPTSSCVPCAGAVPLPLNLGGIGALAYIMPGAVPACVSVLPVGRGRFVYGSSNEVFGTWNALVAAGSGGRFEVFAAHGGEIIPGNLDDHVARIRANLADGVRLPIQVDMDVSMACPSACRFCFSAGYRSSRSGGRMMAPELMLQLIRQWANIGVRVIRFDGGGDPLSHPSLPRALDLCADLGLRTAVLTAGDLLSPRLFETLLRSRTYLRVSLNAATDHTRRILHGQRDDKHGVSRILDLVAELAAARDATHGPAERAEMPIGATSMIHPLNIGETALIARRARQAGFDHLSFRVILGADHRVSFTSEERDSLAAEFEEVRRSVAGPNFRVFMPTRDVTDDGYIPAQYFDACRASTHRALVEVGPAPGVAAVVPCGRYRGHGYRADDGSERVVFGCLDQQTSLSQVWMQPRMARLLATFPGSCHDCIDRSANLLLTNIERILRADPRASFFPFAALDQPGGRHA